MSKQISGAAMVPFTDDQLRALDNAFGDVRLVTAETPAVKPWAPKDAPAPTAPWQAAFRRPTMGEGESFEGAASRDDTRAGATRNFAKAVVVAVSFCGEQAIATEAGKLGQREVRDLWERVRKEYPLAHLAASDELKSLLGQEQAAAEKD